MRPARNVIVVVAVLASCSSGGAGGGPSTGGTPPEPAGCASTGCPAGQTCTSSGCVSLPPLTAAITSPTATVYTNGTVSFSFSVSGTPDRLELLADGAVVMQPTGTSANWDTTSVPEGTHTVVLRAHRGTQSADSAPRTIVVDRTRPTVVARSPETGDENVFYARPFTASFSEPIVLPVPVGVVDGEGAALTASVSTPANDVISIVLAASPAPGSVTIDLSGIVDRAGNPVDLAGGPAWTFSLPLWQSPGGAIALDRDPSQSAFDLSLAGTSSGAWLLGWNEDTGRVSRLEGETWSALGATVSAAGWSAHVLAAPTGAAYATWIETRGIDSVPRLGFWSTGNTWANSGYNTSQYGHVSEVAAAIGGGRIAVAKIELDSLNVSMTLGTMWIGTSMDPLNGGAAHEARIAMTDTGIPVVAFREGGSLPLVPGTISVKRWVATAPGTWEHACGAAAGTGWTPSLAVNGTRIAVAFLVQGTSATELKVRRCVGTEWEDLPSPVVGAEPVWSASVAIDSDGNLIVAHEAGPGTYNGGHDGRILVHEWNGTSWVALGGILSDNRSANPVLAMDPNGHVAVAWEDGPSSQTDVRMMRLNR